MKQHIKNKLKFIFCISLIIGWGFLGHKIINMAKKENEIERENEQDLKEFPFIMKKGVEN